MNQGERVIFLSPVQYLFSLGIVNNEQRPLRLEGPQGIQPCLERESWVRGGQPDSISRSVLSDNPSRLHPTLNVHFTNPFTGGVATPSPLLRMRALFLPPSEIKKNAFSSCST